MAAWSQSPFLQSLGWAMLNSIWQMGLLFAAHSLLNFWCKFSASQRYNLALLFLSLGFGWFCFTFFNGELPTSNSIYSLFAFESHSISTRNKILATASIAYLVILVVPAYRLFCNWQYIQRLKTTGLEKAAAPCRLFVATVSRRLNIKYKVRVYLSSVISSPVTIGFLKPIILLPVAALNNLHPQQVEAILLHELAHIKRFDFLINLLLNVFQTIFYFNPFVKHFVYDIALAREMCCDNLVLQFQYDKVSYASALLALGKATRAAERFALAAAEKKHLLSRIERIVGFDQKEKLNQRWLGGLIFPLLLVLGMNAFFFIKPPKTVLTSKDISFTALESPFYQLNEPAEETQTFSKPHAKKQLNLKQNGIEIVAGVTSKSYDFGKISISEIDPSLTSNVISASFNAAKSAVTEAEKVVVKQTVATTKKVLSQAKWKEVETLIGDGMTTNEKKAAKKEYLAELSKVNWTNLETYLQSEYQNLDWSEINEKLSLSLIDLKLDSVQQSYNNILRHLVISEKAPFLRAAAQNPPLPDVSLEQIQRIKEELHNKIDSIQLLRTGKIINF